MNLQELKNYIDFIANKDQRGGTLSPDKYNSALSSVNIKLFNTELGLEEQYQPGVAVPKRVWDVTKNTTEALRKFKVYMGSAGTMPLQVNSDGWGILPDNYVYPSTLRYRYIKKNKTTRDVEIEVLTDMEASKRLESVVESPTLRHPFCVFMDDYIQFYPQNIQFVQFVYLRLPKTPVYAYTFDANDNILYDAVNSTELEWPTEYHYRIANLILNELSIPIKDEYLTQYTESIKQKGE